MLIIGFFLLVLGADLLVRGSSNIAKRFHIPEILIGLTIVAIGTSLPELVITIFSANNNSTDLIIGNSIGSNLCNLLFILGIIAIIRPIKIDKDTKNIHLPVALFSTIILLCLAQGILGNQPNIIDKRDGIILVVIYLIYFLYPIALEVKKIVNSIKENKKEQVKNKNILVSILFIILGAISLKIGGDLVVDTATDIANVYGISERFIGLTILAIGTALPELITSIIAVIKKEENLAIGNLIGSCNLNIFFILGAGAIITPLNFSKEFVYNTLLLSFSIILILGFCFIGKKNTITRGKGAILLSIFLLYMVSLFV